MGIPFIEWVDDPIEIFLCAKCETCLTGIKHLESENFRGATGTAYLFNHVVNVTMTESTRRVMTTGAHWVRDIDCRYCNTRVGWFYEMALKEDQQYKEGCYILELALTKRIPGMVDILQLRRDKESNSSSPSAPNESVSSMSFDDEKEDVTRCSIMGMPFIEDLGGSETFNCRKCHIFLSNKENLFSTNYTLKEGQAYLFNKVVNITFGKREMHTMFHNKTYIRYFTCKKCSTKLGWMYEFATDECQQFKEGKSLIARCLLRELNYKNKDKIEVFEYVYDSACSSDSSDYGGGGPDDDDDDDDDVEDDNDDDDDEEEAQAQPIAA